MKISHSYVGLPEGSTKVFPQHDVAFSLNASKAMLTKNWGSIDVALI